MVHGHRVRLAPTQPLTPFSVLFAEGRDNEIAHGQLEECLVRGGFTRIINISKLPLKNKEWAW